jgi:hypothetical protein
MTATMTMTMTMTKRKPDHQRGPLQRRRAGLDRWGRVTGPEVGDEESHYEVEVTMPHGGQIDVQLDEGFRVVSSGADDQDQTTAKNRRAASTQVDRRPQAR